MHPKTEICASSTSHANGYAHFAISVTAATVSCVSAHPLTVAVAVAASGGSVTRVAVLVYAEIVSMLAAATSARLVGGLVMLAVAALRRRRPSPPQYMPCSIQVGAERAHARRRPQVRWHQETYCQ